jgi:hypothetical protein
MMTKTALRSLIYLVSIPFEVLCTFHIFSDIAHLKISQTLCRLLSQSVNRNKFCYWKRRLVCLLYSLGARTCQPSLWTKTICFLLNIIEGQAQGKKPITFQTFFTVFLDSMDLKCIRVIRLTCVREKEDSMQKAGG